MDKQAELSEMVIYFSKKTFDMQIPENIFREVTNTFSKFQIEIVPSGEVIIMVPAREKELINQFRKTILDSLEEIKKENSVLSQKLARCHGFR